MTIGHKPHGERYAVIDLGTNSCRMLIAQMNKKPATHTKGTTHQDSTNRHEFRIISNFSRVVRLGEGLSQTGKLSDSGMKRTLEALCICKKRIHAKGVTRIRAVATEACRRAANTNLFLEKVKHETGFHLDVITGKEEAELGLLACHPLIDRHSSYALMFDIGGGSTEMTFIRAQHHNKFEIIASVSLPYGVVTLAEDLNANYDDIVIKIKERICDLPFYADMAQALKARSIQFIGMSNTVTTLASLSMNLRRYNRDAVDGHQLAATDMHRQTKRLRKLQDNGDAMPRSIPKNSADLVLPGCAILTGIHTALPFENTMVADRGLREGLLADMIAHKPFNA